jgi:hypothetical protein
MQTKKTAGQPTKYNSCRHILSLSGGKDSTALTLYMRDRVPEMEYVFSDTGEELPETYDYLLRIEARIGKKITRLNPDRPFQHYLDIYRGVLPDPRTRWCTRMLKLKPFERYVGDDDVCLYVGIRADEKDRKGYISTKPNISSCFPFVEDGIIQSDVIRILNDSSLGLPDYYRWRSRSGCYFCFFQQRREWVGLLENHPELFQRAMKFEKLNVEPGESYTWVEGESLAELSRPERVAAIKADYELRRKRPQRGQVAGSLADVFDLDGTANQKGCLICHL